MSHLMHVLRRKLGGVIGELVEGPSSYRPAEVENSGTLPVSVSFKTTNPGDTLVEAATPMPVTAASLPLPTGAATSAKQDTGNTSVASLDTKLGEVQASPTANTLLARLKTIADALAGALTAVVSGTVTANQGTAAATAWPTSDAGFKVATEHKIVNSADATGIIDITDAPTAGQKRVLVDIIVSTDTAMNVTVLEETSGTVKHGPWYLAGPSGVPQATTRSTPMSKLDTADKKYRLDASVAGNITVETWSYSEA